MQNVLSRCEISTSALLLKETQGCVYGVVSSTPLKVLYLPLSDDS